MKLDFDQDAQSLMISKYSRSGITIGNREFRQTFVAFGSQIIVDSCPPYIADLKPSHIAGIVALGVDIIIIGTGSEQHFLDMSILGPALESAVGVEMMETGAACRSYNVLVSESRAVAGLLYPLS